MPEKLLLSITDMPIDELPLTELNDMPCAEPIKIAPKKLKVKQRATSRNLMSNN